MDVARANRGDRIGEQPIVRAPSCLRSREIFFETVRSVLFPDAGEVVQRDLSDVRHSLKFCIIITAAGPTRTTKMPGKMKSTSGNSICTAVF